MANKEESIKERLIRQVVNRLRNFGFVHVTKENITTDEVYSLYFSKILNDMLGENKKTDLVVKQLLNAMNIQNKTNVNNA